MLATGSSMFLFIPDASNERVLHPGKVIESNAQNFVAEFEEAITPVVGSDVFAYGDVRGKFFQQAASVVELGQLCGTDVQPEDSAETGIISVPQFAFLRVGEPVSAENRQTFRVSVATSGIVALIGREGLCRVVDLSPDGFGAIVAAEYKLGSLLPVTLNFDGRVIATTARIQTVKARPDGTFRYGFLASEKGTVRNSLEQISMSIQRTQLKRLAGAA